MILAHHLAYVALACLAITLVLLAGIGARVPHCRELFRAWDNLGAALAGGDGRHSISAYCGRHHANGTSWICGVLLYAAINKVFGAAHCDNAYRAEFPEDFKKE